MEQVKDYENVISFAFDYTEHEQTVMPYNFKYLFDMNVEYYRKLGIKYARKNLILLSF